MTTALNPADFKPVLLTPVDVPEWEAEDILGGQLSGVVQKAQADQIREMLNQVEVRLPPDIIRSELVGYASSRQTPLAAATVQPDVYDYHLIGVPVNIVAPEDKRVVRLRLRLQLGGADIPEPVLAFDLYPQNMSQEQVVSLGKASIDISKALSFVCPVPLLADALGLTLEFPIGWKSEFIQVRSSGPMSNPVEWYVCDSSITAGFAGYAIVRVPKSHQFAVSAQLWIELRQPGPIGHLLKARFESAAQVYEIGASHP